MKDELLKGGAHRILIKDQIKWSYNPKIPGQLGLLLNFDSFITQEEVFRVFEQHFGVCKDWKIPKREG